MITKFKVGDKVVVNISPDKPSEPGAVIATHRDNYGNIEHTIKFDDSRLIPPQMDFPEFLISMSKKDSVCPVCKTEWSIVKFNMKTWKDCLKCKKTYEDIMQQTKNSPPSLPKTSSEQDWLQEFELMLDGLDDLDLIDSNFHNSGCLNDDDWDDEF
jgi:hypothetical protein